MKRMIWWLDVFFINILHVNFKLHYFFLQSKIAKKSFLFFDFNDFLRYLQKKKKLLHENSIQ